MLTKSGRLSNRNAVRRSSRYGRQAKYGELSIRYIDNSKGVPRLAVVVSKKVSKRAVERNKIRRKIIESYRQNWESKLQGGFDLVIFVHNNRILKRNSRELAVDIGELLSKAKLN